MTRKWQLAERDQSAAVEVHAAHDVIALARGRGRAFAFSIWDLREQQRLSWRAILARCLKQEAR